MFIRKTQFDDSKKEKKGHLSNSKPRFMRVMTTAASARAIDLRDWGKVDSRRASRAPGMERSQHAGHNAALVMPRAHRPARERPRDDGTVDRGLGHHAGRRSERGSPRRSEATVTETSNSRKRTSWLAFYTDATNENPSACFTGHASEVSRAHEELRTVSDVICHNLSAPLRHILGFTQLLREKAYSDLDNSHRYHLDTVQESAKKLSALMDDLLKLARLERTKTDKKQLGLNKPVEEGLNQLHPEIAGQSTIRQVERLAAALADLSKLLLAMSNLIATKLKFTRARSSARIEIRTRTSDAVEPTILVRDNGVGRDAHNLPGHTQGRTARHRKP